MASSSDEALDESIPEMVYQCISLIDTANERKEPSLKCLLCKRPGEKFTCASCICDGSFMHSKSKEKRDFDRFADKQVRLKEINERKAQVLKSYEEAFARKIEMEEVKWKIHAHKEKIKLLEKSIQTCTDNISRSEKSIVSLKEKTSELMQVTDKLSAKTSRLEECVMDVNEEKEQMISNLDREKHSYRAFVKEEISKLETEIFPITFIEPPSKSTDEGKCAALQEAMGHAYVGGKWSVNGGQYSVAYPVIPGNGDYSPYIMWCEAIKSDHSQEDRCNLPTNRKCNFDTAYGISSALGYTAQFVNVITRYLNIQVPRRCNFDDFCIYKNEELFLHNVAKLNANIIHLCLSMGLDVSELNAHRTIPNLVLLLRHIQSEENWTFSPAVQEWPSAELSIAFLEDALSRDLLSFASSDDESDGFDRLSQDDEFNNIPESVPPPQPSFIESVTDSISNLFWKSPTK